MSVVVEDETSSWAAPCAGQKKTVKSRPLQYNQYNAHERRVRVARDAEVCDNLLWVLSSPTRGGSVHDT